MLVKEIHRYPLKSAASNPLTEAEIGFTGIEMDRHWMIVDQGGNFVSQRQKGAQKLSLIRVCLLADGLELLAPEMPPLLVPYKSKNPQRRSVELHKKPLEGIDAGDLAAAWINEYLGSKEQQTLRLVYFPDDYRRNIRNQFVDDATTQFADGYPILIASCASLEFLNEALVSGGIDPVNMNVFRPNLVLEELEAWGEDRLRQIQIGEQVVLEIVKPCERCPITGVTQETGNFSRRPTEPRKTLERIHSGKDLLDSFPDLPEELLNSPMFGQNATVLKAGRIREGDSVTILSNRAGDKTT